MYLPLEREGALEEWRFRVLAKAVQINHIITKILELWSIRRIFKKTLNKPQGVNFNKDKFLERC